MNECVAGDVIWSQRHLHRGQDNAGDGGIQPFRAGSDSENAPMQMGFLPRVE